VAPHGPYLELFPDGSTARQGLYRGGVQVGPWVNWTPEGEVHSLRVLYPGESGRHLPRPEDLCPPGSFRERSRGHDHKRRLWSRCLAENEAGEEVLVGPYVTWNEEPAPEGGVRYVLRRIAHYQDDELHGPRRLYEGPFGKEVLVEEETFQNGKLEGDSRSFFLDGALREQRFYKDGLLEGKRIGYSLHGSERWRVTYEKDRPVAAEGDLTVDGQPCSENTVPYLSADGREEACARRYTYSIHRHGAFLLRDEAGRIVERGLYNNGWKKELWQAPPGVELPPEVEDDVLVAQVELLVGERTFDELQTPPPLPDVWKSATLHGETAEQVEAEIATLKEREAELQAEQAAKYLPFDIWFKNNRTKKYPNPRTVVRGGVVEVYGLPPGDYYMKVEIDANRANELQWPGDLFASHDFQVQEGEITRTSAQLLHSLHLLEPWDNDQPLPGAHRPCRAEEAVLARKAGGVRFAWEPPSGEDPTGIEYVYRLTRRNCDPLQVLEVIADGTTADTTVHFELPPSHRGEVYEWSLVAKRAGRPIGQMMVFSKDGGYGWSVRFRVK
jgi:antitoxin component YwqK of YwqJK toxin-antitoxin module